jgi:DNA-binding HxlR family transcriptional regulator
MATKRSYQEACRFAYALDLVGERWALLIVRELLLGPKRFTDLREGLPHASTNILSDRLRELEANAVVHRHKLPPPFGSTVYELTEWGRELEPVVTRLGAWGARSPVPPESREIGPDSIVLALRSLFDPEAAGDLDATYELRIGEQPFRVGIAAGGLDLSRDPAEAPAATLTFPDAPTMAAVLTGQLPFDQALASGALQLDGPRQAAKRFLRLFPMPEPCECEASAAAPEAVPAGSRSG